MNNIKNLSRLNLMTLIVIVLSFSSENAFSQIDHSISICYNKEEAAKCTGSAYCTACKNCSGCGYCNSGGSCGVCSNPRLNSNTPTTKLKTYNNSSYYLEDDKNSKYYLKSLIVKTTSLNLRSGPSLEYKTILKLEKEQELVFLANKDGWIKVQVKSTKKTGFVHSDYVTVSI